MLERRPTPSESPSARYISPIPWRVALALGAARPGTLPRSSRAASTSAPSARRVRRELWRWSGIGATFLGTDRSVTLDRELDERAVVLNRKTRDRLVGWQEEGIDPLMLGELRQPVIDAQQEIT